MAGVDYLRAMIDGTLPPPPMAGLMQFDLVSADPGRVVFTCDAESIPAPTIANPTPDSGIERISDVAGQVVSSPPRRF